MDKILLISLIIQLAAIIFGFAYGVKKSFKKKGILFLQIITCALGCMGLGQLFGVIRFALEGEMPQGFSIGILGTIGCYLFLLSASYGQIDGLGDSGSKEFMKYRLAALTAPVLIAFAIGAAAVSPADTADKTVSIIILIFTLPCSYYNLKHILLPDVELGILRAIRVYNILALVFTLFNIAATLLKVYNMNDFGFVINIAGAAVLALMMPLADKGVKQWFI